MVRVRGSITNRIFFASALLAMLSIGAAVYLISARMTGETEAATLVDEQRRSQFENVARTAQLTADLPKFRAVVEIADRPTRQPIAADYQLQAGADLLRIAAMPGFQQDPAAASVPFDSRARGVASRTLAQDEPRVIEVVAKRFAFEPARIEVTEGERIRLVVSSADGVHGVGIKEFKVEKSVPRGGMPVTIDFVASAAGEFPILCSEYCGKGHEEMTGMLVVSARE